MNLLHKALIIDKSDFIRKILTHHLQAKNIAVKTANNGTEGLALFYKALPDCVIIDTNLSDITGLQVIQEMKKYDSNTNIIITNDVLEKQDVTQLINLGIKKFNLKPYRIDKLLESMER